MSEMNKGVLIVALPQHGAITAATYELLTAGRKVADALGEPLCCAVLIGSGAAEGAKELIERGADKVYTIDHPSLANFNDELHARALGDLAEKEKFGKILLPASVSGRSLAARLSVRLKAGLAVEVYELAANAGKLTAKRYMYSGNLTAEVEIKTPVAIITIQPMVWPRAEKQAGRTGETIPVAFDPAAKPARTQFVSFQPEESNEVDLATAERVVSGGRGLGNAEGFKIIREFAHAINAAVGASRAVVDSGWIPYRHQVGLTGRAVRPKLYVACGISGQIQHLAGMSSSGNIVAINTDPECPMMQIATLSVVGDLNEMVPLIVAEIKKRKGHAVAA